MQTNFIYPYPFLEKRLKCGASFSSTSFTIMVAFSFPTPSSPDQSHKSSVFTHQQNSYEKVRVRGAMAWMIYLSPFVFLLFNPYPFFNFLLTETPLSSFSKKEALKVVERK